MNVSAELIQSLENMLTTDQFKKFKHAVRLENNPQAALLDAWGLTPNSFTPASARSAAIIAGLSGTRRTSRSFVVPSTSARSLA